MASSPRRQVRTLKKRDEGTTLTAMRAVLSERYRPYLAAAVLLSLFLALGLYAWRVDHAPWEIEIVRWLQDSGAPGLRPVSIRYVISLSVE